MAFQFGSTNFTSGTIGQNQGQATIVYVVEAGNIDAIDAGDTYALQIQAGQALAAQIVLIVSST